MRASRSLCTGGYSGFESCHQQIIAIHEGITTGRSSHFCWPTPTAMHPKQLLETNPHGLDCYFLFPAAFALLEQQKEGGSVMAVPYCAATTWTWLGFHVK